ncbi:response regulator BaeR [Candidatus Saccharibacteria bacterium RAAC3_TM7_1]|nr:response regulator BaeR [Candidatus Saccharibacteria bacterium RAAC3_TM7_1]HCZ28407.1 response regulator [Candidatus Saccharibacteria bacterium]
MNKPQLIIVEDDQWLAEHYRRVLEREGYEIYHAPHALAAIDLIDDVRPQAIILDVLLTGTNALALLHELQSHTDLAKIPVILATNLADQIMLDDVQSYGVKRILNKATMHPEDIITAVRSVLL